MEAGILIITIIILVKGKEREVIVNTVREAVGGWTMDV